MAAADESEQPRDEEPARKKSRNLPPHMQAKAVIDKWQLGWTPQTQAWVVNRARFEISLIDHVATVAIGIHSVRFGRSCIDNSVQTRRPHKAIRIHM
eukprot:7773966-Pyramimonas_sp.AAC.1